MTRRFLALGDSYTIGEGVDASERWPVQLTRVLRAEKIDLEEPRIIAKTGWTTAELLAAVDGASPTLERDFDLVSLLVGVNDQYRGLGAGSFRSGFEALFARAASLGARDPTRVVVVSIPDWSVTPFAASDPRDSAAIAAEIDEFNLFARESATRRAAAFVDITSESRRAASDPALLAADQLHPSGAMYASWVRRILPVARKVLGA